MYLFIVNPQAGNGRGLRIFNKLKKSNLFQSLDSAVYITKFPGHAELIVKHVQKSSKIKTIVVIGGDGTVHEVINGLDDTNIHIGFIPGGSGNDFARGLDIRGKPIEILRRIVNDSSGRKYWIGSYAIDEQQSKKYVNSVGFGFDAQIADKANHTIYKKIFNRIGLGKLTYIIALIQVIFRFKPMSIEIEWNDEKRLLTNCWMVTTCNHPYYGGGMKIIPTARIEPGVVPLLIIHNISKWKVLAVFFTVFSGKHVQFKEVEIIETSGFQLYSDKNIYVQVDGQTFQCCKGSLTKKEKSIKISATKTTQTI